MTSPPEPGHGAPTGMLPAGPRGWARRALTARVGGLPRPFWWLWLGTLVNRAGTFIEPFAVLYLTGPRHLSVATAGVVVTVWGAGALISQPAGGVLTDRYGRRVALGTGLFGSAAALAALALARGLTAIVVTVFVLGVVGDLYRPAANAVIADLLQGEQRTRAFALQFWAINLGFSLATVSAGFLARAGFGLLFALDALTTALYGAIVLRAVPETRPASAAEPRDGPDPPGALTVIARDTHFCLAVLLALTYAVLYAQVYLALPLAMRDAGLGTSAYGSVIAVNGIAIVVLQPLAVGWLARGRRTVLLPLAIVLVGAGLALSGLCATVWQFALTVLLWTFGEIVLSSLLFPLVSDMAPEALRGRYLGVFGLSWGVAGVIGPLLGAWLYGRDPALLWWGCLLLAAAGAVGFHRLAAVVGRSPSGGRRRGGRTQPGRSDAKKVALINSGDQQTYPVAQRPRNADDHRDRGAVPKQGRPAERGGQLRR